MPTFRVRNLSVTLDTVEQAAEIDRFCRKPSIPNCLQVTVPNCLADTGWKITETLCFRLSPHGCGLLSPHGCGLLSPHTCGLLASTMPTFDLQPPAFDKLTPRIKTLDDPNILKALEIELSDAMMAIQERGIELDKQFRPQSLADAEAVEKELEAALAELKKMKKDLK